MRINFAKHDLVEGFYGPGIGITGEMLLAPLRDGRRFRLKAPFDVQSRGRMVHCPVGMVTDFASVPRFFWRLFPPMGRYTFAAVAHDHLYQSGETTRAEADAIFLDLMARLEVPRWQRWPMWSALRLGGGRAWRNYRKGKWKVEGPRD